MFGAEKGTADKLDGKKLHIGIVQARFNESITNTLAAAAAQSCWPWACKKSTSSMCWCPERSKCPWPCRPWPKAMNTTR